MSSRKKILFGFVTLTLLTGMLEGAARVLRQTRDHKSTAHAQSDRPVMRDDVLHHTWKPSHESIDSARETPYRLVTNRQSWVEEYDVAVAKPPNTYRIFYVGDSNTQGVVDPEYKMVEIVERKLNAAVRRAHPEVDRGGVPLAARPPVRMDRATKTLAGKLPVAPLRFEVINAGTSSYSFLLYYIQIKDRILPYSPDLVVLNIDMTDVVNDYVYRKTAVRRANGEIQAVLPSSFIDTARYRMTPQGLVELSSVAPVSHWLINHSAFCYYLDRTMAHFKGGTRADTKVSGVLDDRANWLAHEWSAQTTASVNESMDVLRQTLRLLKSLGVKVTVTGVPHLPQYTGEWSAKPHDILAQTVAEEQVPYLNSYVAIQQAVAHDVEISELYWPSDPTHLNIAGNEVWARAQFEFLADAAYQLLPRRPGIELAR